ncbi:AsmA-like C-terminal region [Jannaschia faecimaris]|uniref:AsmA-like C-terminal region n=1 Tax=Jannaschia faecimaris TaxID=1244108 RepID=A0A1H3RRL2_9RHOB|nr:AsmA-like C-terminal region-containing protein [Jannaschia faecimaris]SDZ28273.1 AsmA-like C-terminal region [Jannaschia faecimaris]
MTDPSPRRSRRVPRALTLVLLVVVSLLGGAAWRLTEGPIALPDWTIERIEQRIARDMAPRDVSLGQVALFYDLEDQALRLALSGAELSEEDVPIVSLPSARVALDGKALLRGKLRPRTIDVDGLVLDVSRDAEGRLSLAFGSGGGTLPSTWAEALETVDALLATPAIAALDEVTVAGVAVRFDDAITGLAQQTEDGTVIWRREEDGLRLSLTSDLRLGPETAQIAVSLARRADSGQGAEARVVLTGLSMGGLAEVLPNVPALTLVTGEVSATASMSLAEDGTPGPLRGRVVGRGARMVDRPALAMDRAILAFDWLPGSGRIGLSEIAAASDDVDITAEGQILLDDGLTGPIQMQLRMGRTILDPEGLLDRRVEFDQGVFEARLTQQPLALRIGQAMVTGPSGTARLSGNLVFGASGPDGALRLAVPRMSVSDLVALWPPTLQVQARTWFTNNMLLGTATGATALLRIAPGRPPDVAASFDFQDSSFRYMRFMPPALDTDGAAQLSDNRLTLRVDRGRVATAEQEGTGGDIDIAGTVFSILDTTERPSTGDLSLLARGEIGDMLELLDNRPFRLLERLRKSRDFVAGQAEARVSVRLPLRRGNAPVDIAYEVGARLTDVTSRDIVPGKVLAADALILTVVPGQVQIEGDMTLEGVPFSGRWSQTLPPPSTEAIDPDAPPGPDEPLPEPGSVAGTARVSAEGLTRLGITLDALELSGSALADIAVSLPPGAPPRLTVTSDLRGMTAALPAISWRKPRDGTAQLEVEATLSETADITRIAIDAPGLTASGRVSLRPGNDGLLQATFDAVDTGWFRGPLVLTGRGAGVAPAIGIRGGRADLRRALLVGEGGGDGGEGAPLDIALERLTITEGIVMTDLRASLRGGSGEFTGRINGGAAVEGVLVPQAGGSAVQIRGNDGGGVLRSAGLFEDARGGSISLTLRPTGATGAYAGQLRMGDLRVREAPALASLLQALSVVGILEQLTGEGLFFETVESDFTLRPEDIVVRRASAVGPSMSITADGTFDIGTKMMDLQGVISPIYLVNGLFGALFSRPDEGLFGFSYRLTGQAEDPDVDVNPLSILTPGIFRDIFRRPPPS